jgi:tetratricopeptide (TPR) repeat protein
MAATLSKIAHSFHFKLDQKAPLEKQQDFCMEKVLKRCGQSKWEYTVGCEDAISQLTDSLGRSLLIRAIESDNAKLCRALTSRQIAISVVNADGDTALHTAARTGHVGCIVALCPYFSLDKQNLQGETANGILGKSQTTTKVLNSLEGLALRLLGPDKYAEALEIYRQIYRLYEAHSAAESRKHIVVENMICCLIELKRIDEALELMEKNLPWKVTAYEENSQVMANTWSRFGDCLLEKGRDEEALEMFKKALQVWEKVERKKDLALAHISKSIGLCYRVLEKE